MKHKSFPSLRALRSTKGFTLLEMMLVVMIIGLLLGAAIHYMGKNVDVARSARIKADIQGISTELKMYYALNGFYPTTEQGLQALVTKPSDDPKPTQWQALMDQVPPDPWQQPYAYKCPGTHNPDSYDLYTTSGKADDSADVGNWTDASK
jgi:general secretion pathway protein G